MLPPMTRPPAADNADALPPAAPAASPETARGPSPAPSSDVRDGGDSESAVTIDEARRALAHNVVWFRPPMADLGTQCLGCGAEAETGLQLRGSGPTAYDIELPYCRRCAGPIRRPRRLAALWFLAGITLAVPLAGVGLLWAAGVSLEGGSPVLSVVVPLLFLAPFAASAWYVVQRCVPTGVESADFRPESGEVALRFELRPVAERIFALNWEQPGGDGAAGPAGNSGVEQASTGGSR